MKLDQISIAVAKRSAAATAAAAATGFYEPEWVAQPDGVGVGGEQ